MGWIVQGGGSPPPKAETGDVTNAADRRRDTLDGRADQTPNIDEGAPERRAQTLERLNNHQNNTQTSDPDQSPIVVIHQTSRAEMRINMLRARLEQIKKASFIDAILGLACYASVGMLVSIGKLLVVVGAGSGVVAGVAAIGSVLATVAAGVCLVGTVVYPFLSLKKLFIDSSKAKNELKQAIRRSRQRR